MSVAENTTSLLNGCTVIFADEEDQYPENFADFIVNNKIGILWATPSKFKMYLQSKNCWKALGNLKLVVLAGEVLDFETARLSSKFPFQLYNTYGPTETTIISTYYHVEKIEPNLPIGRPFANEWCYVVNSDGNLCEVGEKGELFIAGQCVAAGYKNNIAQSEEKFLKNTFGAGIMYRTGDLVALEQDGYLHFYGRKDNQVKVHGFRVELEEIESVIYEYTKSKTVVYYNEGRLVAFIEASVGKPNLSSELKRVLPDYMIPAVIYYVERFPLNNNDKTDKKALIGLLSNSTPSEYVAPKNEIEQLIANCWSQYLNGVKVGIDDDFYQLGGDSIIAMRIASALRKQKIGISMFDIMNSKTIRTLINDIERHQKENINLIKTFIDPSLCASEDVNVSLNTYFEYQANFDLQSDSQEYTPMKMHKNIMDSTCSLNRIIYRIEGTTNKGLIIEAVKKLIKNNAAFRTIYNRNNGRCSQFNFIDNWIIPCLKTKEVNKRFLEADSEVNLKGNIQYLSYVFLAEDHDGILYIVIMIHWRFIDRTAAQIIRKQLVAYLNDNELRSIGITDPLQYTGFIMAGGFKRDVIPNDIATMLAEFTALSRDKEMDSLLSHLSCVNFNCHISFSKSLFDIYNNSPLNFIINIFVSVLGTIFNKNKIPIYIVDQNRNMTNSNLIDTVIDFIPLVVSNEKNDYYKYIRKMLDLRQPGESLIESGGWNISEELLPFINYVSVLDENDITDIEIFDKTAFTIEMEKKQNNRISCSAFIKNGKLVLSCSLPNSSGAILQSTIKQLLSD